MAVGPTAMLMPLYKYRRWVAAAVVVVVPAAAAAKDVGDVAAAGGGGEAVGVVAAWLRLEKMTLG